MFVQSNKRRIKNMEYRTLPHGGEKISVIGMGSSVVGEQKEADIIRTVEYALDVGINYFDMQAAMRRFSRLMERHWRGAERKRCSRCISGPIIRPGNMAGRQISRRSSARWTGS